MVILPAIDLKDGNAVRLVKGDFATVNKVADDPIKTAKRFEDQGADWIHMVDLDGALEGKPMNLDVIEDVVKNTTLYVEVGGGIRNMDTIDKYVDKGVKRVILGSIAMTDPDFVAKAVEKYDDIIAVGIDAKNGLVRGGGWLEGSEINFMDLARKMDQVGVRTIIYTDIERDGTLEGPNKDELNLLNSEVDANIIASGGVSSIDDIGNLASLGLYGTIVGKAIYTGDVDLVEAIDVAKNFR